MQILAPAFLLALGGTASDLPQADAAQPQAATTRQSTSNLVPRYGPPATAPVRRPAKSAQQGCRPGDPREVVVCAQRQDKYRLDSDVLDAGREAERVNRSISAPVPVAQASCSALPSGCGTGLEGLDLLNVAIVVGKTVVTAAKGEDWTKVLKTGGPDEYELYLAAKQQRLAREDEQATAEAVAKVKAEVAEAKAKEADPGD